MGPAKERLTLHHVYLQSRSPRQTPVINGALPLPGDYDLREHRRTSPQVGGDV